MRKIGVIISKGGTGKSTTAINLCAGLARLKHRTLLIDTDSQGQAGVMLGADPEYGLAELMLDDIDFNDAIEEVRPNLFLLAGGGRMGKVKQSIARKEYQAEYTLNDTLSRYDKDFDFVVVDTGPGWDSLTINILFYINEVLAPVSTEIMAVRSLIDFKARILEIQSHKIDLELKYILPTFADGRVKKTEEILTQLKKHFSRVLCSPIKYNVRLSEAAGFGQSIFEYSPKSAGAKDYTKLIRRVINA